MKYLLILLLPIFSQAQYPRTDTIISGKDTIYLNCDRPFDTTYIWDWDSSITNTIFYDTSFFSKGILHTGILRGDTWRDSFYLDPLFLDSIKTREDSLIQFGCINVTLAALVIIDSMRNIQDSLIQLLDECRAGKLKAKYLRNKQEVDLNIILNSIGPPHNNLFIKPEDNEY